MKNLSKKSKVIITLAIIQIAVLVSRWICFYFGDFIFCIYEPTGDVVILTLAISILALGFFLKKSD